MSDDKKQWTKKDHDTLIALIGSLIKNAHIFKGLGEKGDIKEAFDIKNSQEFGLGIFLGSVYFGFADYWGREHGNAISKEDVDFMVFQITQVKDMITDGLLK